VARHAGEPFVFLGVNSDEDREALKPALARQGITWRSWADGGTTGPIATAWGVHNWPAFYVIDGSGVIRFHVQTGRQLDEAVDKLLREMARNPTKTRGEPGA
jgi:hypothetical protein